MSLRFGFRETDIARREGSIISWLGFRDRMPGEELASLFSEWAAGPYADPAYALTDLALENLVGRGTIRAVEVGGGAELDVYNLADRAAAEDIDPNTVELTPREMLLMRYMDTQRSESQTAAELDRHLGLGHGLESESWRTEGCLGHLASLGVLQAVGNPPGAYRLS